MVHMSLIHKIKKAGCVIGVCWDTPVLADQELGETE